MVVGVAPFRSSPYVPVAAPAGPQRFAPGRAVVSEKHGIGTLLACLSASGKTVSNPSAQAWVEFNGGRRLVATHTLEPRVPRSELLSVARVPEWLRARARMDCEWQARGQFEPHFDWQTVELFHARYAGRALPNLRANLPESERAELQEALQASRHAESTLASCGTVSKARINQIRKGADTTGEMAKRVYEALEQAELKGLPRNRPIRPAEGVALQGQLNILRQLGWSYDAIGHAVGLSPDFCRVVHQTAARPGFDIAMRLRERAQNFIRLSWPLPPLGFNPEDIATLRARLEALPIEDTDAVSHSLAQAVWEVVAGAHDAGHGPGTFQPKDRKTRPLLGDAKRMLDHFDLLPPKAVDPWIPGDGFFPLWDPAPNLLSQRQLAALRQEIAASGYRSPTIGTWAGLGETVVPSIATKTNTTPETAQRIRDAIARLKTANVERDAPSSNEVRKALATKADALYLLGWSYPALGEVCGCSEDFIRDVHLQKVNAPIARAERIERGLSALAALSEPLAPAELLGSNVRRLHERVQKLLVLGIKPEQRLAKPLAQNVWQLVTAATAAGLVPMRLPPGESTQPQLKKAIAMLERVSAALAA